MFYRFGDFWVLGDLATQGHGVSVYAYSMPLLIRLQVSVKELTGKGLIFGPQFSHLLHYLKKALHTVKYFQNTS